MNTSLRTFLARAASPFEKVTKSVEYAFAYPFVAAWPTPIAVRFVRARKRVHIRGMTVTRLIQDNMKRVLGSPCDHRTVKEMARENYQLIKFFKLDYYLFVKKYPLSSQQWVTIHGVENLHHALGQARTVHFFTAHYGALYQLPLIIQPFGVIPVIALEHPGKGPLPHWEDSIEKRFFETHIDDVYRKRAIHLYRRGTGFLPVYTRLKKGGVLGTVVDVPAETGSSESATTIPFLGGRVSFCNEFARFALKTRALLIPVFLRIKHPAHYEMSIYQPLDTETWASKQGPVEACMRHCFALIESKIREDPAQWWLWKDLDHFWHGHA